MCSAREKQVEQSLLGFRAFHWVFHSVQRVESTLAFQHDPLEILAEILAEMCGSNVIPSKWLTLRVQKASRVTTACGFFIR